MHLESWQRINHYRNGRELCRKDLLVKNLKRRKRQLEREGQYEEARACQNAARRERAFTPRVVGLRTGTCILFNC